jgi:hypothetical protein
MEASKPTPRSRARAARAKPRAAETALAEESTEAAHVAGTDDGPAARATSFLQRAPLRRRLRYLGRRRELALRELGGLVFDAHREGRDAGAPLAAKLAEIGRIEEECGRLEQALGERRELVLLREPGVTVCSNCSTLHGSEDRFCPHCATPVRSRARRSTTAATPAR